MDNFKSGDLVYCPILGTQIFEVYEVNSTEYPIRVKDKATGRITSDILTRDGRVYASHDYSQRILFRPTKKNRKLIKMLYGVEVDPLRKQHSSHTHRFKPGDLVYWPSQSARVLTVGTNRAEEAKNFPLKIVDPASRATIGTTTACGREWTSNDIPTIVPATAANCKMLAAIYGVEFEAPQEEKQ